MPYNINYKHKCNPISKHNLFTIEINRQNIYEINFIMPIMFMLTIVTEKSILYLSKMSFFPLNHNHPIYWVFDVNIMV